MGEAIGVIGAGYLGATQAVCLAELGHCVLALDTDAEKVAWLNRGAPPFFEPGLGDLLQRNLSSGRLRFTTSSVELAAHAGIQVVCVGTPQQVDGLAADTSQVFAAANAVVPHLRAPTLLVGRSTVPVGTAARLAELCTRIAPAGVNVEVAWSPEFLREGQAVADTMDPARLVFGVTSAEAEKTLRRIFGVGEDHDRVVVTDLATAELVKVSANAFLATKISFANALADLCEAVGGDVLTLTDALGRDERIGRHFLGTGVGYGGGCLPKDLRALLARAGEVGVGSSFAFLAEVDAINLRQRQRVLDAAVAECGGDVAGRRIAALGASFKPMTDDVRDSPALDIAGRLHALGARVVVHDPVANESAARTHPALAYASSVEEALGGAHLVVHLTEWAEFAALDPLALLPLVARPRMLDARSSLDRSLWEEAGWSYRALGRPNGSHRYGR
jgi:UDPglucose 6-dehydrogenase